MTIIMRIIEVDKAFSKAVLKNRYKEISWASKKNVLGINVRVAVFHQLRGWSSALSERKQTVPDVGHTLP